MIVRENRAAARRALAELGTRRFSALLRPIAFTAPADGRTWCDQCQRRVTKDEGRACGQPFCDMQPARLGSRSEAERYAA
jgi:hypothetical protein